MVKTAAHWLPDYYRASCVVGTSTEGVASEHWIQQDLAVKAVEVCGIVAENCLLFGTIVVADIAVFVVDAYGRRVSSVHVVFLVDAAQFFELAAVV